MLAYTVSSFLDNVVCKSSQADTIVLLYLLFLNFLALFLFQLLKINSAMSMNALRNFSGALKVSRRVFV